MKNYYNTVFLCLFGFVATTLHSQVYVNLNAQGSNNGTSWTDAYTNLSDAIYNSSENDELWIASGSYLPGLNESSKDSSFTLPHNLKLYGGFSGNESNFEERNINLNITELTGDVNGDDISNDFNNNRTDNCIHVMFFGDFLTTETVIDGITVSHGNTVNFSGTGNERRGGGILSFSPITLENCTFTQNWGFFGAAFYPRVVEKSIIKNCTFLNNSTSFRGGGILLVGSCDVEDCTFSDGLGDGSGQGISIATGSTANADISIKNTTFNNNNSLFDNGAAIEIGNDGVLNLEIEDCIISDNSSIRGAISLVSLQGSANIEFNRCRFSGNNCTIDGSAIRSVLNDDATISFTNCYIESNTLALDGGAVSITGGNSNFISSILSSNGSDTLKGGAIYYIASDTSEMNLMNVTFVNNMSTSGSDLLVLDSGSPESQISISSQNTIYASDLNNSFVSESNNVEVISTGGNVVVDNSLSTEFTMANDLNGTDPGFLDPLANDFRLSEDSPAIDNGSAENAPAKDIEGNLRQGDVDSGALEYIEPNGITIIDPAKISFSLMPNPSSAELQYTFDHKRTGPMSISIVSTLGQTIMKTSIDKQTSSYTGSISIEDLALGQYYFLIDLGDNSSSITKFVKI